MRIANDLDNFTGLQRGGGPALLPDSQFNAFCEELLRRHFGNIDQHDGDPELETPLERGEAMARLTTILERLGSETQSRHFDNHSIEQWVALGDDWALTIEFRGAGDLDFEFDGADDDNEQEAATVSGIHYTLVSASGDAGERFRILLEENGFTHSSKDGENAHVKAWYAMPSTHRPYALDPLRLDRLRFEDYKANYDPSVVESVQHLIDHTLPSAGHGLIILEGPPGTGKSYLIRMLASETKRRSVFCSPASYFLQEAHLLQKLARRFKKSMIVFEDVGTFLTRENVTTHADATATLLNLTDGIFAEVANTLLVLSFNSDMGQLSDAVTRPGRCLAHIKVGRLAHDQAQSLVPFDIPRRSYTLAEVYDMRAQGKVTSSRIELRAGFRRE